MSIFIPGIVKERSYLKIFFMFERVIWMAVALNTGHCRALPNLKGSIDPIQDSSDPELLIFGSTFIIVHRISVKSSGNQLILCGVW